MIILEKDNDTVDNMNDVYLIFKEDFERFRNDFDEDDHVTIESFEFCNEDAGYDFEKKVEEEVKAKYPDISFDMMATEYGYEGWIYNEDNKEIPIETLKEIILMIEDISMSVEFEIWYSNGKCLKDTYSIGYTFDTAKTFDGKEIKISW